MNDQGPECRNQNNNDHEQLTLAKLFGVARYFN